MAKLLYTVVVVALIGLIQAGPIPKEFQEVAPEIRKTCMKESSATLEMIENAAKGEFSEDPELKCYFKCVYDQFRLISKKGLNYDALIALTPPSMKPNVLKMVAACRDTKGKEGDLCDLSFNITKCFMKENPDDFFVM